MELDDITSILAGTAFFDICTPEQQRLLAFASEGRRFREGDVLYAEGDAGEGAYIIVRGSVALTDTAQQGRRSHRVDGPDAMIGEMALVLDRPRSKTATALGQVETLFVPRAAFTKLMRQYPDMAQRAAAHIAGELDYYLGAVDRFRVRAAGGM